MAKVRAWCQSDSCRAVGLDPRAACQSAVSKKPGNAQALQCHRNTAYLTWGGGVDEKTPPWEEEVRVTQCEG